MRSPSGFCCEVTEPIVFMMAETVFIFIQETDTKAGIFSARYRKSKKDIIIEYEI